LHRLSTTNYTDRSRNKMNAQNTWKLLKSKHSCTSNLRVRVPTVSSTSTHKTGLATNGNRTLAYPYH